jgi:hypothetical protein
MSHISLCMDNPQFTTAELLGPVPAEPPKPLPQTMAANPALSEADALYIAADMSGGYHVKDDDLITVNGTTMTIADLFEAFKRTLQALTKENQ